MYNLHCILNFLTRVQCYIGLKMKYYNSAGIKLALIFGLNKFSSEGSTETQYFKISLILHIFLAIETEIHFSKEKLT